jgi:hypothetical protein
MFRSPWCKRPRSGSASQQVVIRMNIEQVPKPSNVDADPAHSWGRLPSDSRRAKQTLFESTGAMMTACWQEEFCSNTGDPAQCKARRWSNQPPARAGLGRVGSRRGPYYRRSRVMLVEGRGLGSRAMKEEAKARRLAQAYKLPNGSGSFRKHWMPKRRANGSCAKA